MTGEVGNVALLFQVPDLDLGVLGSRAEDEPVGVELCRGERHSGEVAHFGQQCAGADIREGPVLIGRRGQHVVAGRVQRQSRDRALVGAKDACRL